MLFSDSFSLAFRTIKSNKLRTGITVTIIALGITALIGIITAIASLNQRLKESFAIMGANSFFIHYRAWTVHLGAEGGQVKKTTKKALKEKKANARRIISD